MKEIRLIMFFSFFSTVIFGQANQDTTKLDKNSTTIVPATVSINLPETLQIKDISEKKDTQSFLEKNIPWFVALLIGILSAIVNFWIAHRLRLSNERNMLNQIDSNERNLQRQIESNERSLNKQIETNKETIMLEFKATISTKNRQEWLNELRHTLSEYLSSTSLIYPLSQNPPQNLIEQRSKLIERMSLSKAKLELLMTKDKPEQSLVLKEIEGMLSVIVNHNTDDYVNKIKSARTNIINASRKLFEIHWSKIKELK